MKRSFCTLFVALTFGTSAALFAQDSAEARRQAFVQGFEQLLKNTDEGLAKPVVVETVIEDGVTKNVQKFNIAPVTLRGAQVEAASPNATASATGNTITANLGIKVWFTLEDGTAFNPIKRKMGVKEKFYVHIQSAVPVFVSLFQNYPNSQPESRQVYPSKDHPETLKVIQANVPTRLPVPFEMDDNTLDEIMAMVVVRADAPQIQTTVVTTTTTVSGTAVNAPATTTLSVTNNAGTNTVAAQASASTEGIMKGINDKAAGEKIGEGTIKFNIAAPVVAATTVAVQNNVVPNDVAFYMLGSGYAGQWQLTLKK